MVASALRLLHSHSLFNMPVVVNHFKLIPPPASGYGDPHFANVIMLLHFDGANGSTVIVDSSGSPKTVTAQGGAALTTAQSRFGGSSMRLSDTTADHMSFAASETFAAAGEDFTIEGHLRPDHFNAYNQVYSDTVGPMQMLVEGSTLKWFDAPAAAAPAVLPLLAWSHYAIERVSGIVTVYLDGVGGAPVAKAGAVTVRRMGSYNGSIEFFNGCMDEIRVTKGVARYNGNFVPPYAPFPDMFGAIAPLNMMDVPGLKLWLDGSDASTVAVSGGNVTLWSDKSGQGNHATPRSGFPYSYGAAVQNGLNALVGVGGQADLDHTLVLPSGGHYLYMVMGSTVDTFGAGTNSAGTNYLLRVSSYAGGTIIEGAASAGGGNTFFSGLGTGVQDGTVNVLAHLGRPSNTMIGFNAVSQNDAYTQAFNIRQLNEDNYGSFRLTGKLCEVVGGDTNLSPAWDAYIRSQLKAKWGTP